MSLRLLPYLLISLVLSFIHAFDGDIYDFYLPNGLKVILMEKHSVPKVGIGMYYNVGSHDEKWGQKGINALMPRFISEGTEKYPKQKLEKILNEYSMDSGWWDNRDITAFYTELPIKELEFGLDFEADRLQNVKITTETLIKIKTQYKIDLDDYNRNTLNWRFNNVYREILPDDHPYKIDDWGLWEQIDTLSISTCQSYYNQYFAPNNAILVIVGDIIPENVTKLVYKYFGSLNPSKNIPADPDFLFDAKIDTQIPTFIAEDYQAVFYQQWYYVNFLMPSSRNDDTIILGHLESILQLDVNKNGSLTKIFTKDRRLIDMLYIYDNIGIGPSSFSVLGINAMKTASPYKVKKSILKTFQYIGKHGIDNALLQEYKKSEQLKLYMDNTNFTNIANRLGTSEIINGDYKFYNRTYDILDNMTNDDIKRVVKQYMIEDNVYVFELDVNKDKKRWFLQLTSFLIHNTIFRIWSPFEE